MAQVTKIDSNATGSSWAQEASYKVLPGSPVWNRLEPNNYETFGSEITLTPRDPIVDHRQRKKGVTTDLDASAAFEHDLTYFGIQELLQGFMWASFRPKDEFGGASQITSVTTAPNKYFGTSIDVGLVVGDLIFASGFTNTA